MDMPDENATPAPADDTTAAPMPADAPAGDAAPATEAPADGGEEHHDENPAV